MKKFLLAIVVITLTFTLVSRSNAQGGLSLGLKAGLNIANASIDPENLYGAGVSKGSRTGFMVGGVAEFGLSPMIFIQVEPMYAQKGTKYEGGGGTATFKLDYLEIPILFKAKFTAGDAVKPYVFAGPNVGINLASKITTEGGGITQDTDIKDSLKTVDFGIDFGAGAEFKVAPKIAITGDVRYSLGLANIDNSSSPGAPSIKPNGFQILVGVLFRLHE